MQNEIEIDPLIMRTVEEHLIGFDSVTLYFGDFLTHLF